MQPHWKAALVGGTAILALTADARAQNLPQPPANQLAPAAGQTPLYDPQQLPAQRGQIQQFTLTPRGDIDGLILTDGTEVKTPPHLSTQIAYAIKPGDTVTIHGLHAAALPLVQAVSITDDATGRMVIDNGPTGPGRRPPAPPPPIATATGAGEPLPGLTEVQSRVRMALHGPQGDVNGALLDDGTIVAPSAAGGVSLREPAATGTDDRCGGIGAHHRDGQGLGRAADRRLARAVEPRRTGPGTCSRAPSTAASRIWTARSATSVSRGIRPFTSNPAKELPHALA
jgi:hypothetical protein